MGQWWPAFSAIWHWRALFLVLFKKKYKKKTLSKLDPLWQNFLEPCMWNLHLKVNAVIDTEKHYFISQYNQMWILSTILKHFYILQYIWMKMLSFILIYILTYCSTFKWKRCLSYWNIFYILQYIWMKTLSFILKHFLHTAVHLNENAFFHTETFFTYCSTFKWKRCLSYWNIFYILQYIWMKTLSFILINILTYCSTFKWKGCLSYRNTFLYTAVHLNEKAVFHIEIHSYILQYIWM